ncbi:MAG TPA: hypothetical protein VMT52_03175 [Planctomycetota bacterium]|nr:hypothetical protein [Planctomycetota bacterium]
MHTATDTARVKVLVDSTPPAVTPPDDETVSATEAGGARGGASTELHKFLFNSATANDNSTAIFTHLPPRVDGADVDDNTLFPHGTTTVTFRIADSFGNVGTATAEVYVTDLQSGDLFVGVGAPTLGTQNKGVVKRIRGGAVTDFCTSPDHSGARSDATLDPDFWNRPDQIVVDSRGRVAFLAYLGLPDPFFPQSSWGLARCNLPGQPAEKLATFPGLSVIQPGWPVPLPGRTFYNAPSGLHLRRTKFIVIDDNVNNGNPQIVTTEKYVLAFQDSLLPGDSTGHIGSLSLDTESLEFAENDISPVGIGTTSAHPQILLPSMFYHSRIETVSFLALTVPVPVAKTYVTAAERGGGQLRRIHHPLEVQLTANTPVGTVQLGVQAFGGFLEMPNSPIGDDIKIPNAPSGCNPPGGVRGDWPLRLGSYASVQSSAVIFEKNSGLVFSAGFSSPAWTGHVDEALFDLNGLNDREAYFARPETGCAIEPVVNFTPLAGDGEFITSSGYDFDSMGRGLRPDRMAASPNGLFGTLAAQGRVAQATGAVDLVDVATGLSAPRGLGAFPPQLGNVQLSALIIRIDSPVDVELTDGLGRRLGVANGGAVNEMGSQAHDTGPETHPRLYIIQHPQPGKYAVRSTGTGSGPFTVHVYSVDSEKKVTAHISHTGDAQPGSTGKHDFDLSENRNIAFSNATPVADAGEDQTLASAGEATSVALDGSASSDPDDDALSFTWSGPFGTLTGATVAAVLPAGVHVLTLIVDDGKGGIAKDTVAITLLTRFHRGDPNASGNVDISDGITIFGFLFLGDPPGLTCDESADANNDDRIDLSDGIYLLDWLFLGGAEPPAPGPTTKPCGFDPDPPDNLGCQAYPACN